MNSECDKLRKKIWNDIVGFCIFYLLFIISALFINKIGNDFGVFFFIWVIFWLASPIYYFFKFTLPKILALKSRSVPDQTNELRKMEEASFDVHGLIKPKADLPLKQPGQQGFIKSISRDKRAIGLCDHLRGLSIDAQLLTDHQLQRAATEQSALEWLLGPHKKSIGFIQITGRNIAYINVVQSVGYVSESGSLDYYLEYLVSVVDIQCSLPYKTVLKKTSRSRFWGKIVDIEWKGGLLANRLNNDHSLKERFLTYLQENMNFEIKIVPEACYGYVKIETTGIQRDRMLEQPIIHFPSRTMFDCLDRVALHVIDEIAMGGGQ